MGRDTYGSNTSGEKSPSSICNAYSPPELRQMSPVTSHMTALASSPSTPRSSRQSGKIFFNFFFKLSGIKF